MQRGLGEPRGFLRVGQSVLGCVALRPGTLPHPGALLRVRLRSRAQVAIPARWDANVGRVPVPRISDPGPARTRVKRVETRRRPGLGAAAAAVHRGVGRYSCWDTQGQGSRVISPGSHWGAMVGSSPGWAANAMSSNRSNIPPPHRGTIPLPLPVLRPVSQHLAPGPTNWLHKRMWRHRRKRRKQLVAASFTGVYSVDLVSRAELQILSSISLCIPCRASQRSSHHDSGSRLASPPAPRTLVVVSSPITLNRPQVLGPARPAAVSRSFKSVLITRSSL